MELNLYKAEHYATSESGGRGSQETGAELTAASRSPDQTGFNWTEPVCSAWSPTEPN